MTTTLPLTAPDCVCWDDVDLFARETGSDLESLAQDIYHTLLEAPGSNIDVPDRGVGVESYLSGSAANLPALATTIDTELEKDGRIDKSSSSVTQDADGTYVLSVKVQAGAAVLGISFAYTKATGLTMTGWSAT